MHRGGCEQLGRPRRPEPVFWSRRASSARDREALATWALSIQVGGWSCVVTACRAAASVTRRTRMGGGDSLPRPCAGGAQRVPYGAPSENLHRAGPTRTSERAPVPTPVVPAGRSACGTGGCAWSADSCDVREPPRCELGSESRPARGPCVIDRETRLIMFGPESAPVRVRREHCRPAPSADHDVSRSFR